MVRGEYTRAIFSKYDSTRVIYFANNFPRATPPRYPLISTPTSCASSPVFQLHLWLPSPGLLVILGNRGGLRNACYNGAIIVRVR